MPGWIGWWSLNYKLIAADLDGTLMGEDAIISPKVKDAVHRAMEKGVRFTIATGRAFGSVLPFAEELEINAPLICYQGGLIKDHLSGQVIYEQSVALLLAQEFIRLTQQRGLHLNVYLDGRAYVERVTPEARYYTQIAKAAVYPVGDMLAFLDRAPMKFIIVLSDDEATEPLIAELGALFAGQMWFVRSYPRFVEGIPLGVSKGHALARLVAHLGLSLGETIGVGDNDNDLELVERAGLGVAMGNASPAVTAAADYIAPSVDKEGVAEVIERFVLSGANGTSILASGTTSQGKERGEG
jgi:Cof subfamily protein (haloacid dehalogenase superfamily)